MFETVDQESTGCCHRGFDAFWFGSERVECRNENWWPKECDICLPCGNATLHCPEVSRLVGSTEAASFPEDIDSCAPYRLILYADEISPGNVLKADNRRKVFAIYWAIAESRMHIQPTFMRVSIYQHSFWNPLSTRFVRMRVLRNLAAACCQPNHLGSS